jgi:hypothetical protein
LGSDSRRDLDVVYGSIISIIGFDRWDVADGLKQPKMVAPVDPIERGTFDGFELRHGPRLLTTSAL